MISFILMYNRFHHGVSRCYCPSKEVAKRALVDGLDDSQIRVFGLPVRPSFPRTIIYKVSSVQFIPFRDFFFNQQKINNIYYYVFF